MTLEKLLAFWAVVGVALGAALFGIVLAFQDSFAAAEELSDIGMIGGRATGVLLLPCLAAGWLAFTLAATLTGDCGVRRWGPVILGALLALATALLLEHHFMPTLFPTVYPPTTFAVVVGAITVGVREWIDS